MPAVSPGQIIQQLPTIVDVLVRVEGRASWKHRLVERDQCRDLRMRPVPMQIVAAMSQSSFVDEIRPERVNITAAQSPRVFMQDGNKIFVRRPDEIRLLKTIEHQPAQYAVLT